MQGKLRGALIGVAVGDALGAAVEFKSPGTFKPVDGYTLSSWLGELLFTSISWGLIHRRLCRFDLRSVNTPSACCGVVYFAIYVVLC
jgi:hypothetical protein